MCVCVCFSSLSLYIYVVIVRHKYIKTLRFFFEYSKRGVTEMHRDEVMAWDRMLRCSSYIFLTCIFFLAALVKLQYHTL